MINIEVKKQFIVGSFQAMACPCEIIVETNHKSLATKIIQKAALEAWRIEKKFSRYRSDNIVHQINNTPETAVTIDEETQKLLQFADIAWQVSNGLFDISSGIFRTIWDFKSSKIPSLNDVKRIKKHIGWQKISLEEASITLPKNMQIDLGGIGKEYAVDKVAQLLQHFQCPILVNFGGDLTATAPPKRKEHWNIGVDDPNNTGKACLQNIPFYQGAIATSGDARNKIEFNGQRYGHIINPLTGFPPINAPRAVTVMADSCVQAGLFSTLAILHGESAETFLNDAECQHWVTW